jgi:hypothetical protein
MKRSTERILTTHTGGLPRARGLTMSERRFDSHPESCVPVLKLDLDAEVGA